MCYDFMLHTANYEYKEEKWKTKQVNKHRLNEEEKNENSSR